VQTSCTHPIEGFLRRHGGKDRLGDSIAWVARGQISVLADSRPAFAADESEHVEKEAKGC
jgi:hypothetical protein